MTNEQTCGTCKACHLLTTPVTKQLAWVCKRHPAVPMLIPKGVVGGVAQMEVMPVWPPTDPKDPTFFCYDWLPKTKDVH